MNKPSNMDIQTAIFLAAICSQTYKQHDTGDEWFLVPPTYRTVGTFTAAAIDGIGEPFGFVLESDRAIILAFRGTSTAVEWISDFIAQQIPFKPVDNGSMTHRGFTDIYMTARDRLFMLLERVPQHKPLFVTGHSLGAALAALAAYDISFNRPHNEIVVYTFASPRVGDPTFARSFSNQISTSVRIANQNDLVTHLPPLIYQPPKSSKIYHYMHVKNEAELNFKAGSVSGNHALSSYFVELAKLDPPFAEEICAYPPGWCPPL
ncbi:lipase family protein [Paenibacillus sp. GCM10027626]|uniref:lipase family protein n=1 Tax=Paenibacillus sp. GCM10027626 TaxID=3273411 RepID=UPI00363BBACC